MASLHGYTNAWDSVLPRLQEALYGEFVISRELGRGGMSAVFLAHQLRLDRKVAIKVMAPTLMTGVGLAERFRDEATTVARLDHPNIISIFEIGSAANLQYFVMQYVPGRSLERATRQHGPLAFDVVRAIVFEVGAALAHAHRHQVIHRDVKPGNILLSLDGRVIVSDFGIAKVTAASARTQTGAVIGTPAYMSPEQCYGLPLTWRADQYSLGVVAYELVTGVQPFAGSSYEVMRRHTEDPVPPVAAHRPDCPPDVAGAIERMLAKRPEDRFASMAEAGAAMGATRTRIGEAVQEAIGRLAIPTLDEEGVVLVHTPASPAPERHPSGPAPSTAPSPAAARSEPMATPRAVALEALARAKRAARNLRGVSARSVHAVGTVVRLIQVLSIGAARQARASRSALGVVAAIGIALAATGAILLVRKAVLERTGLTPRSRSEPSLGAIAARRDSSRGAREIMAGETERDSFAADSLVPDSVAADSVVAAADTVVAGLRIRSRPSIVVGDSLQMAATALDIHGNRLRRHTVTWRVSSNIATIDSVTGLLRALAAGRVRVYATADTVVKFTTVTVTERQPRAAAVDEGSSARDQQPSARLVDEAVDGDAVADVLAAFVRSVLIAKDIGTIRRLYQTPTTADAAARDSLIQEITLNPRLSILPPGSSPKPRFSGDAAYARTKLTMKNAGRRKSPQAELWIEAELRRGVSTWSVIGFKVLPKNE